MLEIFFDKGTLIAEQCISQFSKNFKFFKWDERVQKYRAPAFYYREFILSLREKKISYIDHAKDFLPCTFFLQEKIIPRYYQQHALESWYEKGAKGVVTLPTGAGKTILAILAIERIGRPTLIHVPTIDLMQQWYQVLKRYFNIEIGLLGGGYHNLSTITVSTYDSALLHVPFKGNKFGFLIFDECHHLPGEQLQYTAISSVAPFRLGLTATPERSDGKEELLYKICGPICFQTDIRDLEGVTLAPYDIVTKEIAMTEEEQLLYAENRRKYLDFVRAKNIQFSHNNGWQTFLRVAHQSKEGKEAFQAYLKQKKLAQASSNKENSVWEILCQHRADRILIFTQDNETAYHLGSKFLLPVITHHTKVKERESFLSAFRSGKFNILVTSKVLNEGVDVPDANIAIVVSGSGTVREHVQRLGRILRAKEGKKAILYELISEGTSEYFVNQRRKQHSAYEKRTASI
ncbi:DEAD/DEAH box helicase [Fluviispira multicolorata]|uniref:DNA 3'-5' helicase n=1 Tax=Fluviispira multicolorata TaxID=2654512 RepID=A0A833JF15_9BACT|nr:DEAD/DEAH box helicase family protein [Fluviispira multicolorata]KAB8033501.1 DEAD/DEAH box helicase [Fluviispira multicolorata]